MSLRARLPRGRTDEVPLRILAVGNMYPPHHSGGYEVMWQTVMQRARELGHRVRVVVSDYCGQRGVPESEPEVHRTLRWYWDVDRYDFPMFSPLERLRVERHNARELDRHLNEFRPHVVSWWSMGCMSLALIERVRRMGIPAALIVHDDWLIYGPGFDQWIRMWRGRRRMLAPIAEGLLGLPTKLDLPGAGAFVFNSRYIRDRASLAGVRSDNSTVVYPGIEPDLRTEQPRHPWGWRLLYIGRVDRQKGIDTAVEALARLPAEATLDVWGAGDERYVEEIRGLARKHGLADRVRVHGWAGQQERLFAYQGADVVLFPVRWAEPFGLVPLEAMGLGRPVVSTARGGSAEFLSDGENALVFDGDDAAGLADAVIRLAGSPPLRERLLAGGRRTAERFTIERFADETVGEIVRAAARRTQTECPEPRR